jgi:hypothetical protein
MSGIMKKIITIAGRSPTMACAALAVASPRPGRQVTVTSQEAGRC